MNNDTFRKELHRFADWIADYYEKVDGYPVKSQVQPREIFSQLSRMDCFEEVETETLLADFERILLPGITHWQSPNFYAYFPANTSPPSILAEMLTAALAQQCMIWETSPAATELEEYVMSQLRDLIGLPETFTGVIQDSASTSTLTAMLMARERATNYSINDRGFSGERFRLYCSEEAHSSIEKGVKIAGFGKENLVKIPVDGNFAMIPRELEARIQQDLQAGFLPLAVVSAMGTTGSTAFDPIREIAGIASRYRLFHHVDGAMAGTALILPEMRHLADGLELADSFVFNPHKWMFTNFDCSAFYVKDPEALIRTFSITPEYLKTKRDEEVNNYRDWGIPLGRRFRALKLWFVLRNYGKAGLQTKIREHLRLARLFAEKLGSRKDFRLLAPVALNTVCFHYEPSNYAGDLNELNAGLLDRLNSSGKLYLTHTKLRDQFALRLVVAQTDTTERHIREAFDFIVKTAEEIGLE
ncbi:aromatic-L-amino-acid decarboxylase [Syntrophus gentianae]|uniref:Aromatic-L-amino-acid decarboxylase n=1 Tax=Syntrophus gentianae TaxID=43775 RepID=A0A1H8BK11_9BACT|nr:pyridoxal-dependent decarboxylase [Syntrophus gentianae]SEM82799.1 aromatic-L-amino-acid decarboxylase [Syntrophus gentianae]